MSVGRDIYCSSITGCLPGSTERVVGVIWTSVRVQAVGSRPIPAGDCMILGITFSGKRKRRVPPYQGSSLTILWELYFSLVHTGWCYARLKQGVGWGREVGFSLVCTALSCWKAEQGPVGTLPKKLPVLVHLALFWEEKSQDWKHTAK